MARAKVVHSADAVEVIFQGDPTRPEPSTAVIKFPGGHVEVSRTSDGSYWAHLGVVHPENITDSRIEYSYEAAVALQTIPDVPRASEVKHLALRIGNRHPHFDPNA